jgi:hypothetical protein
VTLDERRLYPPLLSHWRSRGFLAASSVSDPRGRRLEVDVVAYTPDLSDVRVTEAKARATGALVEQCLDRLDLAPLVYAAVPAREAPRALARARDGEAARIGVLSVEPRRVDVLREAAPGEAPAGARAVAFRRLLSGLLAEGRG